MKIVKVQRALNNNNILVYDKTGSIFYEGENKDIYRQLEESKTNKAFFIAEINKGVLQLKTRISDQNF